MLGVWEVGLAPPNSLLDTWGFTKFREPEYRPPNSRLAVTP